MDDTGIYTNAVRLQAKDNAPIDSERMRNRDRDIENRNKEQKFDINSSSQCLCIYKYCFLFAQMDDVIDFISQMTDKCEVV